MKVYGSTPVEQAIDMLTHSLSSISAEKKSLSESLGLILAQDIIAPISTPPFDRSPLDGYAIIAEDSFGASKNSPAVLHLVGSIRAGESSHYNLKNGMAVRIMTGAIMPQGATAVVAQEDADYSYDRVSIFKPVKPYQNYIYAGEDTKAGTTVLYKNTKLGAPELALCASLGIEFLPVHPKPKVAVYSMGSEIQLPGSNLGEGKIYDSNFVYITSRLNELGVQTTYGGIIKDNEDDISSTLEEASSKVDLIITTGGVSVGEKDLMPKLSKQLGKQIFWGIDMKPGSPMLAWKLENTLVLSLSGNPFASSATFEIFAVPVLNRLSDGSVPSLKHLSGVLDSPFTKTSNKRRFIRGRLEDGVVSIPNTHSSGVIRSMVGCNCLVDIPPTGSPLDKNAPVKVLKIYE